MLRSSRRIALVVALSRSVLVGSVWAVIEAVVRHDLDHPGRDTGLGPTGRRLGWGLLATTFSTAREGTGPVAPPIGGFGTAAGGHWPPAGVERTGVTTAHPRPPDLDRPGSGPA